MTLNFIPAGPLSSASALATVAIWSSTAFSEDTAAAKVGCDLKNRWDHEKKPKANLCNPQGNFMHVKAMAVFYLESGLSKCF